MRKVKLGNTGLEITPLIFGTLPMGPLQAGLEAQEGGALIRHALENGVDTLDTAELYRSYPHIRAGLKGFNSSGGDVKIFSKTHATDGETARAHVEKGLRALGVERFDLVHLHGAGLEEPFRDRAEVLDTLCQLREEGKIGHVGISTHFISVVRQATSQSEIEVIHPLINKVGLGIRDGSPEEMAEAIEAASKAGKGIYAMKALGGGNFISEALESIRYVIGCSGVDALAIGMLAMEEIDANIALLAEGKADGAVWEQLSRKNRSIKVLDFICKGCGDCVDACTNGAIRIENAIAKVDEDKCILCGYCAAACPIFAIRVV